MSLVRDNLIQDVEAGPWLSFSLSLAFPGNNITGPRLTTMGAGLARNQIGKKTYQEASESFVLYMNNIIVISLCITIIMVFPHLSGVSSLSSC